jgi:hypothetical protein
MTSGSPSRQLWNTRTLLVCAMLAALAAILLLSLSPVTSALALISPPLYALVASFHFAGPFLAARWTRAPGAAALTALLAGLLAMPFTNLGVLLIPALVIPSLVFDLALIATRFSRNPRVASWYLAASLAAVAIFAISLTVIDPRLMTPLLVVSVLLSRLFSVLLWAWVAVILERALTRAGVRRAPGISAPVGDSRS